MAQTTFNVQDNTYNSIGYNGAATWNEVHDAVSGGVTANFYTTSADDSGIGYSIYRCFLVFDTSSIPDTDVVSSAELKINVASIDPLLYGHSGTRTIGVVQTTQASTSTLSNSEFDLCGSVDSPTEGATRIAVTSTGVKTLTLNSAGRGFISKTGSTKLGVRAFQDLDDSTPTDGSNEFDISLNPTSTQLVVNHWGLDRYWVGGTGNWNDTANWSDTSGGTGGAPVPTSSNDVYFDANSFDGAGQIVTVDATSYADTLDWTGATNSPTLTGSNKLYVYEDFTTIAAMTWELSEQLNLESQTGATITTNGLELTNTHVVINRSTQTFTLADALTCNRMSVVRGKFDTADFALTTASTFQSAYTTTREIDFGASTVTVGGQFNTSITTGLTMTEGTSTIVMTGDDVYFDGGGETFNDVTLSGDNIEIRSSNTFADLTLTANKQTNLTAGTTQTVTSLTATGSAGNLITVHSTVADTAATLSDAGANTCDFLSLKDITAAGGGVWTAGDNSVDEGGNTGWVNAWTNPANAYTSNDTYATHTAPNGNIYVKLSKDGGTTWEETISVTHTGAEAEKTFGDGTTELWSTTWVGSDVHDANFRLRLYAGSATSFNWVDFYDFAFDGEIAVGKVITGIEVISEAKWDGTTTSLDHVKVRVYSGDSPLEIEEGSITYDSTKDKPVYYEGASASWKEVITEDDLATSSVKGIASFDEDSFTVTSGDVKPQFIGFRAYLSSNTSYGDSSTIVFNAEEFDDGSNYATGTGKFTAPVSGKYRFTCQLWITTTIANIRYGINFLHEGTVIRKYRREAASTGGQAFQSTTLVKLDAGDDFWVTNYEAGAGSPTYEGDTDLTWFEGELIAKD